MMFTHKTIHQRLAQARMQAGLSVSQVGRLYNPEVAAWLRDAEIGKIEIPDAEIDGLAKLYFVDPHWVRTGESSLDLSEIEKYATKMSKEDRQHLIDLLSSLAREE